MGTRQTPIRSNRQINASHEIGFDLVVAGHTANTSIGFSLIFGRDGGRGKGEGGRLQPAVSAKVLILPFAGRVPSSSINKRQSKGTTPRLQNPRPNIQAKDATNQPWQLCN